MAQQMTDEQRKAILEAYNPQDHLISVGTNKDRSPVLYYPAAWRLYELRLRHPHFTLEAEILHMDTEKGTVIIKAVGYDGQDYASSNLKGTAMKQGKIAELDKVETKAKSRVARDIGIGTEYALDMDPDETDATHDASSATGSSPNSNRSGNAQSAARSNVSVTVSSLRSRVGVVKPSGRDGVMTFEQFYQFVAKKPFTADDAISPEECQKINQQLDTIVRTRANKQQSA